jgi:solute carrier family 41
VQAVVVGLLAAIFAMMLGWIPQRKFSVTEGLLLCASSVITAALASLILGIANMLYTNYFTNELDIFVG